LSFLQVKAQPFSRTKPERKVKISANFTKKREKKETSPDADMQQNPYAEYNSNGRYRAN
jgi:hypothetical protein